MFFFCCRNMQGPTAELIPKPTQMSCFVTHTRLSSFQPSNPHSLTCLAGFFLTLISQYQLSHGMFWFCTFACLLVTHTPTQVSGFLSEKHMPFTVEAFGVHHPPPLCRSHFNLMLANVRDVYVTLLYWACRGTVILHVFLLRYGRLNLALILIY